MLQVLYNIRPQAVTAVDLEGTAYDARHRNAKLAKRTKSQHSANFVCRHWPFILGLLASAAFLLLRRQRRILF